MNFPTPGVTCSQGCPPSAGLVHARLKPWAPAAPGDFREGVNLHGRLINNLSFMADMDVYQCTSSKKMYKGTSSKEMVHEMI